MFANGSTAIECGGGLKAAAGFRMARIIAATCFGDPEPVSDPVRQCREDDGNDREQYRL